MRQKLTHAVERSILLSFGFFLGVGLLFFGFTLANGFLSDDYTVLYRLIYQKNLWVTGFFRPLSDMTMYVCYWVAGFDAFVFNLFNLLVHVASTVVLFRLCLTSDLFTSTNRRFVAWMAALLFLIYPFHTESVVWMVGRASSLSGFFGFLCLWVVASALPEKRKLVLLCLFYFLGLASYETLMPLPAILLVLLYQPQRGWRAYLPLAVVLGLTLGLHLLLRQWVAGSLTGDYGGRIFSPSLASYAANAFKVTGKLFLPSSRHSALLAAGFVGVLVALGWGSYRLLKGRGQQRLVYARLLGALLLSCIIPVMFGVSTRTEEGNRMLYFASFFLALWLAFILGLIRQKALRSWLSVSVLCYFAVFLWLNLQSWRTASRISQAVLAGVNAERTNSQTVGWLNIPQEYKGAHVFRNGFSEALLMQNLDTAKNQLLRTLSTEESELLPKPIAPVRRADGLFVPPNTLLRSDSTLLIVQPYTGDTLRLQQSAFPRLIFWDGEKLVSLR